MSVFGDRRVFAGAVFALMLAAALLRPVPDHFKFRHGGDCVRYLTWSQKVAAEGFSAFPALVTEWHRRWVGFPPPTRWTYLAAVAGVMRLWPHPPDDYHPLVILSWLASVLCLVPLAVWLRRLADPEVTLLALLLTATSPLCRGMAMYPLPDAIQLFSTLAVVAVTAEWLAAPRRTLLVLQALFAFLLVTVRETGLLSVVAAGALVFVDGKKQRAPLYALGAGCLVALLATIPIAGGPAALITLMVTYVAGALKSTGNMPLVSGPPYRYLVDLMLVAPLVLTTALVATAPLLGRMRALLVPVGIVTLILLVTNSFLTKSLRYIMPVEVGLRVLCAAAVWTVFKSGHKRWAIALLLALLAADEALHFVLWQGEQVYDPVTFSIARQLRMIPR